MAKIPGGSAKSRCPPSNAGIHRLLLARDGPERITGREWQGARLARAVRARRGDEDTSSKAMHFRVAVRKFI